MEVFWLERLEMMWNKYKILSKSKRKIEARYLHIDKQGQSR